MSQSARSTIFLDEMGVGAQWKLRNVAAPPEGEPAEEVAGASAAPVASMPPAGRLVAAVAAQDADATPLAVHVVAAA